MKLHRALSWFLIGIFHTARKLMVFLASWVEEMGPYGAAMLPVWGVGDFLSVA